MKDKKAFILYVLLTLIIWQLCVSLSKIITSPLVSIQNDIFEISKTVNNGAAFGIFKDTPYFLGFIGVFVTGIIIFYVCKNLNRGDKEKILLTSIFTAGILGNTTERFLNGYVFDFLKINLFNFPIFNLFDVLITGAVFFYILFYIKNEWKRKKN